LHNGFKDLILHNYFLFADKVKAPTSASNENSVGAELVAGILGKFFKCLLEKACNLFIPDQF
jgi:hypothetical protein